MLSSETRLARRPVVVANAQYSTAHSQQRVFLFLWESGLPSRKFFANKIDRIWRWRIILLSRIHFRDNGDTPAAREEMKKGVSGDEIGQEECSLRGGKTG